jgi:cytochrome P450
MKQHQLLWPDDTIDEEMKKYPDYDIVAQMPYMNMFLSEVLRMYPIANQAVQRRASENTIVQGIKIDKGNYAVSCQETLRMSFIFCRHLSVH